MLPHMSEGAMFDNVSRLFGTTKYMDPQTETRSREKLSIRTRISSRIQIQLLAVEWAHRRETEGLNLLEYAQGCPC